MAQTAPPPKGPVAVDPAGYRAALNHALADLDDATFCHLTELVRRKLARRAAADEVRSMVDAQVRPGLTKLFRRVRRDLELRGRFAAGRLHARGDARA